MKQITSFRTYELAVEFYRETRSCRLPVHLRQQFDRAASSIALNLNEGWGKSGRNDRLRFFSIAFGSIRECQAIFALEPGALRATQARKLDQLAASAYRLLHTAAGAR